MLPFYYDPIRCRKIFIWSTLTNSPSILLHVKWKAIAQPRCGREWRVVERWRPRSGLGMRFFESSRKKKLGLPHPMGSPTWPPQRDEFLEFDSWRINALDLTRNWRRKKNPIKCHGKDALLIKYTKINTIQRHAHKWELLVFYFYF